MPSWCENLTSERLEEIPVAEYPHVYGTVIRKDNIASAYDMCFSTEKLLRILGIGHEDRAHGFDKL